MRRSSATDDALLKVLLSAFNTSREAIIVVSGERNSCETLLANLASACIRSSRLEAIWLKESVSCSRSRSRPTSNRAVKSPVAIALAA